MIRFVIAQRSMQNAADAGGNIFFVEIRSGFFSLGLAFFAADCWSNRIIFAANSAVGP